MMKKIFFLYLTCFSFIICVNAQERQYEAYDEIFKFDVNENGVTLLNPGEEENVGGVNTKSYTYYLSDFSDYVVNIDHNKPFAMYVCKKTVSTQGPGGTLKRNFKYYFFPSEVEKEKYEKNYYEKYKVYDTLSECDYFNEKISGSSENVCPSFDSLEKDIRAILENYKNCSDYSCKLQMNGNLNDEINTMSQVCNTILNYSDYSSQCVKNCLDMETIIKNLKDEIGIKEDNSSTNRICGFSEKLILYIANIVKWGKYLVPVIVIILGILDFIKAITADKDDGMKKAQGRFVKRLIAAALIFIIPFIIEFVLDKMGFDSNGCGIIDL